MRATLPSLAKYPFTASLVRLAREAPVEYTALKCRVLCSGSAGTARRILKTSDGRTAVLLLLLLLLLPCSLNTVETSGPTSKLIPTHNGTIKVDAFKNPFATGLGQMVRWVAQISRNWPTSKSRVISWNLPSSRFLSAFVSFLLHLYYVLSFRLKLSLALIWFYPLGNCLPTSLSTLPAVCYQYQRKRYIMIEI